MKTTDIPPKDLGSRLLPLTHFAKQIGERGTHPSTLTRWILKGVLLPDGSRLHLKAVRAGCRWLVDPADWTDFLNRQTAAHLPAAAAQAPRSPAARQRASEAAARELEKMGF